MSRQWIKTYIEILDDPKMGRLSDHHWRRAMELFLIAGRTDDDGTLPPASEMAWMLRTTEQEIGETLSTLAGVGIVQCSATGVWVVVNFKKRQYSDSYERVKRYRERYSNGESNAEVAEILSSSSSISDSVSSSEGGGVGEGTNRIPETPRQAGEDPHIQTFIKVSGRFPGQREYGTIIDTIKFLREKHGAELEKYLTPYWTAWSTRKTKEGKPYSPASLVWLCEWAMQGDIPRANGHEPKIGKSITADVIRKVAQHATR